MVSPEAKDFPTDDRFAKLRDVFDDQQLREYLQGKGPLSIAELPASLKVSEGFQTFVSSYGWPNRMNADAIAPPHNYTDATDFWRQLYDPTSDDAALNNFRQWISYRPINSVNEAGSIAEQIYATKPALHRAYVIAEPLYDTLRTVVADVSVYDIEALGRKHPEVPEAAYAAYRLLGRLFTKDDLRTQATIMTGRPGTTQPDVTDAHRALIE